VLARDRVLVAPGYFYDFPREAYLVVSLLPDPDVFGAGIDRTLARASALMA
jgi:alanine-synthesizing transaminase